MTRRSIIECHEWLPSDIEWCTDLAYRMHHVTCHRYRRAEHPLKTLQGNYSDSPIVERKLFSAKEKGFRISSKALLAEDTRFCAECEKSLIFRQFSRLQGDDATVIPTVYTGQHVPSSSATVNSTIIPIVVCMTLKQLPMARSALQEGRLSCQQRSLLGIWNLSP